MLYFAREKVDVAVFEVGLGGRLDATRLVNSACSVITGISYDHREHLGETRIEILGEKLGITEAGVPLVANLSTTPLVKAARRRCEAGGVPFHSVREEVQVRLDGISPGRMVFDLATPLHRYRGIVTRLIGAAQLRNAATAVRTAEILAERGIGAQSRIRSPVRRGLASAFLAGRFQIMPGNPRIVLDVAHNEESLLASLDTLRRISERRRSIIILGVLAHKELGAFPARALRSARENMHRSGWCAVWPRRCERRGGCSARTIRC
jgi:dihydrofolate synthase/folylpolyglutamate synthase